jgi:hypothetical protein
VIFTEEATNAILEEATRLCGIYTEQVPLVDRGSTRYKIARLAASLAARTFSCSRKSPETCIVRDVHVRSIARFLDTQYSLPEFGYRDYSEAVNCSHRLLHPKAIRERILGTPFAADLIDQLLHTNEIELRDLQDWTSWDREASMQLLSFFVRKHALIRANRGYQKSTKFITLLKDLRESEELQLLGRPDYLEEEF